MSSKLLAPRVTALAAAVAVQDRDNPKASYEEAEARLNSAREIEAIIVKHESCMRLRRFLQFESVTRIDRGSSLLSVSITQHKRV